MTSFVSFARRQNFDTTTDSICTRCYETIASSADPAGLPPSEAAHPSDPNGEFNLQARHQAHHVDSQRGTF